MLVVLELVAGASLSVRRGAAPTAGRLAVAAVEPAAPEAPVRAATDTRALPPGPSAPTAVPSPAVIAPPAVPPEVAAPAPAVVAAPPAAPLRGVWVHLLDETLLSRASIEGMLDRVAASGANTVIAQVARRHDAYYASELLPRSTHPALEPGLDVLAAVSEGARRRGLAIHAWYTAMPTWGTDSSSGASPNWTSLLHGRGAPEADRWVSRSVTGEWGTYFDPAVPRVQDLVAGVAAELAAYDIDAVHLDYLRYDGAEWGYHPVALQRFAEETGRTDVPDPYDPQWSQWRRGQTTHILQRIRDAVQAVNPAVGVSAAVIAWGDGPVGGRTFADTPAHREVLQPWDQWVASGLLDVAMPMLYFREERHAAYHRNWLSYVGGLAASSDVLIAPGQGSWLNSVAHSTLQLAEAAPVTDGAVLFSYQQSAAEGPPDALLAALPSSVWPLTTP